MHLWCYTNVKFETGLTNHQFVPPPPLSPCPMKFSFLKIIAQYFKSVNFVLIMRSRTVVLRRNISCPLKNHWNHNVVLRKFNFIVHKDKLLCCQLFFLSVRCKELLSFLFLTFFPPLFGCPVLLSASFSLVTIVKGNKPVRLHYDKRLTAVAYWKWPFIFQMEQMHRFSKELSGTLRQPSSIKPLHLATICEALWSLF